MYSVIGVCVHVVQLMKYTADEKCNQDVLKDIEYSEYHAAFCDLDDVRLG